MKLPDFIHDRYFIFLALLIFLSSILTFRFLIYQTTFGYDMARDAFHAYDILFNKNIKIIGPTTDIVGINHGVLWYYVLVIPYLLAQQDPQIAVLFFFLLSILTIPIVWLLSYRLFKDKKVSFVSTVLYSFSPLVIALGSWMSNPILGLYATPLLLLFIYSYIKKQSPKKAFLIGLLYGILIQAELANLLLLPSVLLYILIFKIKPRIQEAILFIVSLFMALLSFVLVEIIFNLRGVHAVLGYLFNGHGNGLPDFPYLINKIKEFFEFTVSPLPDFAVIILMIVIGLGIALFYKKARKSIIFLLIWLSNLILFSLFDTGVSHSSFVFIPSIAAGVILISYVICNFIKSKIILGVLLLVLIFYQVMQVETWLGDDYSPAAIQRSNSARAYKMVVDFTYQTSDGQPFIINTITNPLYINTTWEYLYEFYGNRKYGYKPFFGGRSQEGYQYELERKQFGTKLRYLIIESTIGMPEIYVTKAIYEEDKVSNIIDEAKYGYVVVQKREFVENKPSVEIPEELKNSPVLYE